MESTIVNIDRLGHHFKDQKVLDNISLQIRKGSIYGFLGPNGAGKTTTLRLLLGLLEKQQGKVIIFGSELFINRTHILKQVGSLIEMPSLYAHLTGAENLEIFRLSYQVSKNRISEVLEIVGLSAVGKKKVRSYSLGMKQRLGIALTLLHDPELLILDEPTNGLDPEGIIEMRNLLKRLNQEFGKTILISSHLLGEVEKIITDVAIIHLGKILFEGSFSELQQKKSSQLTIEIEVNDIQRAMELLKDSYAFTQKDGKLLIGYTSDRETAELNAFLVTSGIKVYKFGMQNNTLENIFIQIISN